jgi:molybdopterin biosynthesis enzyme MoaB
MPPATPSASKEVVTAALLVIGGKILSGRTKDQNIGYIAEYLTAIGIDLKEVRVVGDEERAIVDALNALRRRYTYVFTTGGIGPGHKVLVKIATRLLFRLAKMNEANRVAFRPTVTSPPTAWPRRSV